MQNRKRCDLEQKIVRFMNKSHWLSCNLIGYFKQAFKSDWLFCLSVPFSLAGKKMRFRAKNSAIRE
jgi:hypothetical protein